nr:hypothetical protein StreXyl84_39100 [Streptomyces sp. Xyl84]
MYRLPIFRAKTAPTDACCRQNYASDEATFTAETEITRQVSTNIQTREGAAGQADARPGGGRPRISRRAS